MSAGFATTIRAADAVDGPAIDLGRGVHEGAVSRDFLTSRRGRALQRGVFGMLRKRL